MAFQEGGKYESNKGRIYSIKLETARYTAAGIPPTGDIDQDESVIISKTSREFGLRPRGVNLSRTLGTAPDTFKKYSFLPVLSASAWNVDPFVKGKNITIDGIIWTVISVVDEDGD